jgi:predicted DNA binding CopG/RHH family protein
MMVEAKRARNEVRPEFANEEERQDYLEIEKSARRHAPVSSTEMEAWKTAGENALDTKRRRISIMVRERDLEKLKAKAAKLGMPYQTLINSILHQYGEAD